jgi:hypothetical protein
VQADYIDSGAKWPVELPVVVTSSSGSTEPSGSPAPSTPRLVGRLLLPRPPARTSNV